MTDPHRARRSLLTRLFTAPLSPRALEDRARRRGRRVLGWLAALVPAAFLVVLVSALASTWSRRPLDIEPRHRPEALCFALAAPPPFAPPMHIEPSAAVVRQSFPESTPPAVALQKVMRFSDDMVLRARTQRVGDFDVADLWLRIAGSHGPEYWLIVCWMNGADLEVCNFRFEGDGPVLTQAQREWGSRLLLRVLVAANFERDALPRARLRVEGGRTMPVFGPGA
jgi:hypothetical protein